MSTPAEILRSCLIDQGLVTLGSYDNNQQSYPDDSVVCFVASMPDKYDRALGIYNRAGKNFGRTMEDGKRMLHPGLQLLFRMPDESGYEFVNRVANALDQSILRITTTPPGSCTECYVQGVTRGPIIPLGEEVGKRRQLWSINVRISFQDRQPVQG